MIEFGMKIKTVGLRVLVLAVVGLGMAADAGATPVTFGFEAKVDSISTGASFDSELALTEDDRITGQFTFEPNVGDGNSPFVVNQPFAFSVDINGVELSTAAFRTTAHDNTGVDIDCTDCPGFAIIDRLALSEGSLMEVGNSTLENLDADSSGFQMQLEEWFGHSFWGGMDILDAARIPADIETWNQFSSMRSLRVWLGDDRGGTYSVNAIIGNFTVVPEPSSLCLIPPLIAAFLHYTRRNNGRR